jgi:Fibronectin type III domain
MRSFKIITSGSLAFVICWVPLVQAAQSVRLTWSPSHSSNIIGYRLYYGTTSKVYTQKVSVGNTTATSVSNLTDGKTYFFAVSAYTTTSAESVLSNEVSYKAPGSVGGGGGGMAQAMPMPSQAMAMQSQAMQMPAQAGTPKATPATAPTSRVRARSKRSHIHEMQARAIPRVGSVEAAAYARWCNGDLP